MTFEEIKKKIEESDGAFLWGEEDVTLPPEIEKKLPEVVPGSTHELEQREVRKAVLEIERRSLLRDWKKKLTPLADELAQKYYLAHKEEIDAKWAKLKEEAEKSKAKILSRWYQEAAQNGTYSGD